MAGTLSPATGIAVTLQNFVNEAALRRSIHKFGVNMFRDIRVDVVPAATLEYDVQFQLVLIIRNLIYGRRVNIHKFHYYPLV